MSSVSVERFDDEATAGDSVGGAFASLQDVDLQSVVKRVHQILLYTNRIRESCFWSQSRPGSLQFGTGEGFILVHGLCQIGKSWDITVASWLAHFVYDTVPVVFLRNCLEAREQFKRSVQRFNREISNVACEEFPELSQFNLRRLVLVPRDHYESDSSDAQLVMKLTNPVQIRKFLEDEMPVIASARGTHNNGPHPMTLVFDEVDLNVQSTSGAEGEVEKLIHTLRKACFQEIGFTATLAAHALTLSKPVRVTEVPMPLNYYGLSRNVPPPRRPQFHEAIPGREGSAAMISDILQRRLEDGPWVCLIHHELTKKSHAQLQHYLANRFDGEPLLLLTHNGGGTGAASDFGGISAMHCQGNSTEQRCLLEHLAECFPDMLLQGRLSRRQLVAGISEVEDGRMRLSLHKAVTIADVLTAIRILTTDSNLVIAIISGHMGGRAVTFKDTEHRLHLTDIFVEFGPNAHEEHIVQVSNRISGTYNDRPVLRLWTSKEIQRRIDLAHQKVEEMYLLMLDNPDVAPCDLVDGMEFEGLMSCSSPLLTRPRVEQNYKVGPKHSVTSNSQRGSTIKITDKFSSVEEIAPEALDDIALVLFGRRVVVTLFDNVVYITLHDLGIDAGLVSHYIKDLECYPYHSKDLHHILHKKLKQHLEVGLLFTAVSPFSSSRRGMCPLHVVKRDYHGATYTWDANRCVFVAIKRLRTFDGVQAFKERIDEVVAWRAIRAHDGPAAKLDVFMHKITAGGDSVSSDTTNMPGRLTLRRTQSTLQQQSAAPPDEPVTLPCPDSLERPAPCPETLEESRQSKAESLPAPSRPNSKASGSVEGSFSGSTCVLDMLMKRKANHNNIVTIDVESTAEANASISRSGEQNDVGNINVDCMEEASSAISRSKSSLTSLGSDSAQTGILMPDPDVNDFRHRKRGHDVIIKVDGTDEAKSGIRRRKSSPASVGSARAQMESPLLDPAVDCCKQHKPDDVDIDVDCPEKVSSGIRRRKSSPATFGFASAQMEDQVLDPSVNRSRQGKRDDVININADCTAEASRSMSSPASVGSASAQPEGSGNQHDAATLHVETTEEASHGISRGDASSTSDRVRPRMGRKCGEQICYHCQHPGWKRKCLGPGGTVDDAQADYKERYARRKLRKQ